MSVSTISGTRSAAATVGVEVGIGVDDAPDGGGGDAPGEAQAAMIRTRETRVVAATPVRLGEAKW
jgi:hypothetical protein